MDVWRRHRRRRDWQINRALVFATIAAAIGMIVLVLAGYGLLSLDGPYRMPAQGWLVWGIWFIPPVVIGAVLAWWRALRDRKASRGRSRPLSFE